ncbi:uncharacterized protein LOC115883072 isoform X2 [Sitophilus oryzae]|nr:uncharacterized protein LOC115883072 isoform X2 [Sitophilus oryzae]
MCTLKLTIEFNSHKRGIFFRQFVCLIWNDEPLVIEAVGYYGESLSYEKLPHLTRYNFPRHLAFGSGAYLKDSFVKPSDTLPFTLNEKYLDFGRVEQGFSRLSTSITNKLENPIFIEWNIDQDTFKIEPKRSNILGNATAQFECYFYPKMQNHQYFETLIGQVEWPNEKQFANSNPTRPLTCALKVQGHSFPDGEGWIAPLEVVPENIVLYPCLPGFASTSTLKLVNRTHLPVMYKLVPPTKTNVTAKPMMGKFKTYEIIIIHLETEDTHAKSYIEEWKISLNAEEANDIVFYISGQAKIPNLEIGIDNKIVVGSVQEGCEVTSVVHIQNKTDLTTSYQFEWNKQCSLKITPSDGILGPNEDTFAKLTLTAHASQPNRELISCTTHAVDARGAVYGKSYTNEVEVEMETSYSQLCAIPKNKDLGLIEYGSQIKVQFLAYNFGETPVYFHSAYDIVNEPQRRKTLIFKPYFDEVKPKCSRTFHISGPVTLTGPQIVNFGYFNRPSKNSTLPVGNMVELFQLKYVCELPYIQIEDVTEHNFGSLFSRHQLYSNYLNIDNFNYVLKSLSSNRTAEMYIRLPECEITTKEFYMVLFLTNSTNFPTEIVLKRKQMCSCALVEKKTSGFHERKLEYDCIHKEIVSLELSNNKIAPNGIGYLTIRVKYTVPEKTAICHIIQLSHKRHLEIYFNVVAIAKKEPHLAFYSENNESLLELENIFIGTRIAPVQTVWMYNNTRNLVHYNFDITELERLCRIEGFKVLELLNPNDQIDPYSSKALLIRFHPIEAKTYKFSIGATYQIPKGLKKKFELQIHGEGCLKSNETPAHHYFSKSTSNVLQNNLDIVFSQEYITAKDLTVWNKRKKIIFLKNISKEKTIQYIWGSVIINNVLEIHAEKKFGVLEPKEIQPVIIIIKSLAEPCIATVLLPCEIIKYTDTILHELTKEKHESVSQLVTQEFTITDSPAVETKKKPIKIVPKPDPTTITICFDISSIHPKDLDCTMESTKQLKQYPNEAMKNIETRLLEKYYPDKFKKSNFPELTCDLIMNVDEKNLCCKILEELISDVTFSNYFKNYLQIASKAPSHYYLEFIMNDYEIISAKKFQTPLSKEDIASYRKKVVEIFLNQLKLPELSNILENIIYDSMLKMSQCPERKSDIKDVTEKIKNQLLNCKKTDCTCHKNLV